MSMKAAMALSSRRGCGRSLHEVHPKTPRLPHDLREVLERRLPLIQVAAQEPQRRPLVLGRLLLRVQVDEFEGVLEPNVLRYPDVQFLSVPWSSASPRVDN